MGSRFSSRSLRAFAFFGGAIFAMMALWSQLTPLGSGPDEPSSLIKSAAVIRGQLIGHDVEKWLLSIDGWAYDFDAGVAKVIVTGDGEVIGEQVPYSSRADVSSVLNIPTDAKVVFSISALLAKPVPPYSIYVLLNDGSLTTIPLNPVGNVVEEPATSQRVIGVTPMSSPTTYGLVEQSNIRPRIENSYWTTYVDVDNQWLAAQTAPQCFIAQASQPACQAPLEDLDVGSARVYTQMGRYTPLAFAISGVGTLAGASDLAYRLARLMVALSSAAMLGLAAACLSKRRVSLVPLLVAITPGVIFMSSVVNPSATEICAALTLWAVLPGFLAVGIKSKLETVTVAIAGLALIVARPLGMVQYLLVVGIVIVATGSTRRIVQILREHKIIASLHAVAGLFATMWYLLVFNSAVDSKLTESLPAKVPLGEQILHSLGDVPRIIAESIGNFGWLDTPTPQPIALAILLLTAAMIAAGWRSIAESAKLAILLLSVICVLLVVAQDLNYYNILRNYGSQGRHITPLLVGLLLLGARNLMLSRRATRAVIGVWSIAIVVCGLSALRRYAVGVNGDNYFEMFSNPEWRPLLGINGTIFLLVICTAVIAAATSFIEKQIWRERQLTE